MSLTGPLGAPNDSASFKVSRSHLGFVFLEGGSQTGHSSFEELSEVDGLETRGPVAGEPTNGELCDLVTATSEPVT